MDAPDDNAAREGAQWLRAALAGEKIPAHAAIRICLWVLSHVEPEG